MSHDASIDRYSTVAEFELLADGTTFAVAQIAPDFVILRTPSTVPAGPATLIIRTDGEEIRRAIKITSPVESSTRVAISRK